MAKVLDTDGTPIERVDIADRAARLLGQVDASPEPLGTSLVDSIAGAAAAISATLAAAANERTWISGFAVTGGGATAGSIIEVTITGPAATLRYKFAIPAGVLIGAAPLIVAFARPIPAGADNTAIVVNVPTFGLGNTAAAVAAYGFRI